MHKPKQLPVYINVCMYIYIYNYIYIKQTFQRRENHPLCLPKGRPPHSTPSSLLRHFRRDVKQRVAHAEDHRHDCRALVLLSEANVRSLENLSRKRCKRERSWNTKPNRSWSSSPVLLILLRLHLLLLLFFFFFFFFFFSFSSLSSSSSSPASSSSSEIIYCHHHNRVIRMFIDGHQQY